MRLDVYKSGARSASVSESGGGHAICGRNVFKRFVMHYLPAFPASKIGRPASVGI